jgi:hypothetical protein
MSSTTRERTKFSIGRIDQVRTLAEEYVRIIYKFVGVYLFFPFVNRLVAPVQIRWAGLVCLKLEYSDKETSGVSA